MRCYFLRGGQLAGVNMLPRGLSDQDAVARAETQSLKRRSPIDGLEVWDRGLCHSNDTRSTNGMACRGPVSQSLSREAAPLDQRGRASLFVNLAGHEMALLVEMFADMRVN